MDDWLQHYEESTDV